MDTKKNGKNGNGHSTHLDISLPREQSLDELDLKILAMRFENPGIPMTELEAATGITRSAIWLRSKKPGYREAIEEAKQDAIDILNSARRKAARRLVQLIDSHIDLGVAYRASTAIIADALPARKVDISGVMTHVHFEAEQAQETLVDKLDRIEAGNLKEQRN